MQVGIPIQNSVLNYSYGWAMVDIQWNFIGVGPGHPQVRTPPRTLSCRKVEGADGAVAPNIQLSAIWRWISNP